MTPAQAALRILRFEPADFVPVVHFGYWPDTLQIWAREGHLTEEEARGWRDGNVIDARIAEKLGFDMNWYSAFEPYYSLRPAFERKVVRELGDGSRHVMNEEGVTLLEAPGAVSIQAEIDHLLKDRASWEEHYKWRFQWTPERVTQSWVRAGDQMLRWDEGGLDYLRKGERSYHYGIHCGSLIGFIRNVIGVEALAYMYMDDEALLDEIIQTIADLCYQNTRYALEAGARFDFAHFWEDICYKNGPLIAPQVFAEKIGPQYRRITELVRSYGIDIVSVDSDGKIDALLPTWLENGVNTMFPIEVGTWDANIGPWRQKYGKQVRGVGGMNKVVLTRDRQAVDAEIERLRPLVELGGYLPCPDHRLAPDCKWDLVRYYTDRFRVVFGR